MTLVLSLNGWEAAAMEFVDAPTPAAEEKVEEPKDATPAKGEKKADAKHAKAEEKQPDAKAEKKKPAAAKPEEKQPEEKQLNAKKADAKDEEKKPAEAKPDAKKQDARPVEAKPKADAKELVEKPPDYPPVEKPPNCSSVSAEPRPGPADANDGLLWRLVILGLLIAIAGLQVSLLLGRRTSLASRLGLRKLAEVLPKKPPFGEYRRRLAELAEALEWLPATLELKDLVRFRFGLRDLAGSEHAGTALRRMRALGGEVAEILARPEWRHFAPLLSLLVTQEQPASNDLSDGDAPPIAVPPLSVLPNPAEPPRPDEVRAVVQPTQQPTFDRVLPGARYDSLTSTRWGDGPGLTSQRVAVDDQRPFRAHGGWGGSEVAGAFAGLTVRGPSHVKAGSRCQDAHRVAVRDDGTLVVAVADGLGSAELSDVGARFVTGRLIEVLAAHAPADGPVDLRRVLHRVRLELLQLAEILGVESRSLACTALLAVWSEKQCQWAKVGDGAIVARVGGSLRLVGPPEKTQFVNEVTPLSADRWERGYAEGTSSDTTFLAIFTDGIERQCLDKDADGQLTPLAGFFEPLERALTAGRTARDLETLVRDLSRKVLDSESMRERSDDDKTLLIAARTT